MKAVTAKILKCSYLTQFLTFSHSVNCPSKYTWIPTFFPLTPTFYILNSARYSGFTSTCHFRPPFPNMENAGIARSLLPNKLPKSKISSLSVKIWAQERGTFAKLYTWSICPDLAHYISDCHVVNCTVETRSIAFWRPPDRRERIRTGCTARGPRSERRMEHSALRSTIMGGLKFNPRLK